MADLDRQGRTLLHYAALANDVDAVTRMLGEGADPNVPDRDGFTALHFAAQQGAVAAAFNSRGRGELIGLLRRHGADPWHAGNAGQTPAGLARMIGNYDVAQFFADLSGPDPEA
jgi:uncharacterized protein